MHLKLIEGCTSLTFFNLQFLHFYILLSILNRYLESYLIKTMFALNTSTCISIADIMFSFVETQPHGL